MAGQTLRNVLVTAVGFLLLCGTPSQGQTIISGGTARENAASAAARAPGFMVNAGVARAQEFANAARAGVEITVTEEPKSIVATALLDAFPQIFIELAELFDYFEDLLRARAGLPSSEPDPTPPPADDGTKDDGDGRGDSRKSRER